MVDYKALALGTLDTITIVAIIIVILALIGFIGFTIWQSKQYKHRVRVRELVNGRKIVTDVRAREFKEDSGLYYWKLKGFKEKIPLPPPEAIEIDKKGVQCVEVYRTPTGEYFYLLDKGNIAEIPKDIINFKSLTLPKDILDMPDSNEKLKKLQEWKALNTKEGLLNEWKLSNNVIKAFEPLTTNQRIILIDQIKKAQDKRKKSLTELIAQIVPYAAITIIIISLLIFYEDMGKPLLNMAEKVENMEDKYIRQEELQVKQLELMAEIKNNMQTIQNQGVAPS